MTRITGLDGFVVIVTVSHADAPGVIGIGDGEEAALDDWKRKAATDMGRRIFTTASQIAEEQQSGVRLVPLMDDDQ